MAVNRPVDKPRATSRMNRVDMPPVIERLDEIEQFAGKILSTAYREEKAIQLPIALAKVLRNYGLQVKTGRFKDALVAASYERSTQTILVAADEIPIRQNFVVAHFLGHFFLHKKKTEEILFRSQAIQMQAIELEDLESHQEQQANAFAIHLLMPRPAVERLWSETPDIAQAAKACGVSPISALWQLKNLGLIQ